ncbi:CHASE2 domain protein [Rivularia sp. PCC 7116]|uniref:CHASE2 domain-containing protein n=1 Tax=Rivularia sp. PCC 7116 TaxID=373994 RepID=UPI00029ECB0D|nr:CHASE2 domain-containing protein [Rivularia sp. PCC 7116]AFY57568.1 CHASE2 domain protein [Rivularia sp. PCC 7116]
MRNEYNIFNLKIHKFKQVCLFELCWGKGQRLTAEINYPNNLNQLHQQWQQAYLSFYQSDAMRGRAINGGVAVLTIDWHAELVKAEAKLMYEFHRWLRSVELYDIRSRIAGASQELIDTSDKTQVVQVFVTCNSIELERYPWEVWEMGSEFATNSPIQIIRSSLNISKPIETTFEQNYRKRPRILAILGDDTGLNFQVDKDAIKPILKIAEVEFLSWQPQQKPSQFIQQISDAITDDKGWDVLFFAGHSNETEITGGELGIAPNVSISINEIAPQLSVAKQRGLNVAIFNSCSGLNIAQSLIELGFGQVVVMREPIHNRVAQEFLVRFLQGLAKHLDIYESVAQARQFLRMEKSHTYPSSYLVPSIFCHPGAKLYRIPPFRWKDRLRQSLPNPTEGILLTATFFLAIFPPVQDMLLNTRMLNQAVYRDITAQISNEAPPVTLIEIDSESIYRAQLPHSQLLPFNRSYIAKLLDKLTTLNATVVGIDFIFDSPQKNPPSGDKDLGLAVRRAVDQNMWLIFGAVLEFDREIGINEAIGITKWDWTLQAYLNANPYILELPKSEADCSNTCPFSYLLSLVQTAKQEASNLPQPNTNRTTNLRDELLDVIEQNSNKGNLSNLSKLLKLPSEFRLEALEAYIDYSLPPKQVYTKIPAWKLLESKNINEFQLIPKQVVLIAVGSDERLGFALGKPDRSISPLAIIYWNHRKDWLTGGESLAYMTHHFLRNHLLTPIPDIWMMGIMVIFGKITALFLKKKSPFTPKLRLKIILTSLGIVMFYGVVSLQLYITTVVLIPWLLPSVVFLGYIIPLTKNNHV